MKLKMGSISIILVDSIVADKMKKKKKIPVGRLIPTHVSNSSEPSNHSIQAARQPCPVARRAGRILGRSEEWRDESMADEHGRAQDNKTVKGN